MKFKLPLIAALSASLIGCVDNYVPFSFQTTSVSPGAYNSLSCTELNKSVDKALIETNTLFIALLRNETISSPRAAEASAYFNSAPQSELTDFSRLKGELEALKKTASDKNCGRYVMSPEELIEYQVNQVRKAHGVPGDTSYPVKIIRFDKTENRN